ncbi:cell envelope biogenesis protein TolA [Bradyrhizobium elkanii]|uniref:cell envelope biogenesis protein TolA n=1 Tax=Bradyrhizobium elkanii TaxID=29448 RepID=UPI00351380F3
MARKLKTFQTSLGFYDLAIAAPSMKAALEAWGAGSNLFHQGVAEETDDPDVVAATMSKPGVVLKRPAGSNGRFAEHSDLPSDLGSSENRGRRARRRPKPAKRAAPKISEREARNAAAHFEKEQKRREAERRREQAARKRDRDRRERAMAKAQAALDKAEREHDRKAAAIQAEVEALEKRSRAEDDRWDKEREGLQAVLRRARG